MGNKSSLPDHDGIQNTSSHKRKYQLSPSLSSSPSVSPSPSPRLLSRKSRSPSVEKPVAKRARTDSLSRQLLQRLHRHKKNPQQTSGVNSQPRQSPNTEFSNFSFEWDSDMSTDDDSDSECGASPSRTHHIEAACTSPRPLVSAKSEHLVDHTQLCEPNYDHSKLSNNNIPSPTSSVSLLTSSLPEHRTLLIQISTVKWSPTLESILTARSPSTRTLLDAEDHHLDVDTCREFESFVSSRAPSFRPHLAFLMAASSFREKYLGFVACYKLSMDHQSKQAMMVAEARWLYRQYLQPIYAQISQPIISKLESMGIATSSPAPSEDHLNQTIWLHSDIFQPAAQEIFNLLRIGPFSEFTQSRTHTSTNTTATTTMTTFPSTNSPTS